MKNKVIISLLGSSLDRGLSAKRWEHWRPSVAITQHEDLLINRYHLLYQPNDIELAKTVAADITSTSPETKLILEPIDYKDPWNFEEVYATFFDYAKKYQFDCDNEEYLIHITTGSHVAQICLFLLTESHHLPGKLLQSSPYKQQRKNIAGYYSIINLDLSCYDHLANRFQIKKNDDIAFLKSGIETKDKKFNALISMIEKVSLRSKDPILLTGPTGAGKSQLARRIYELKKLNHQITGNFVEVNCATLRGDNAMSNLFGHHKGAFTGAINKRKGLLKEANKGILFLDEIGELGLDEQAMLLHAIEEKRFYPLGSDSEEESDFQLLCGSNKNLENAVNSGKFREDLLARIKLWTFKLPSLSERLADLDPNINYEINKFSKKTGELISFNHEAKELFLKFATSPEAKWIANFRDLNAAITRMGTLANQGRIKITDVNNEIKRLKTSWQLKTNNNRKNLTNLEKYLGADYKNNFDRFDLTQLTDVIKVCLESNSLSEAGRKLFAVSRATKAKSNDADRLRKYLQKFALSWHDFKK